MASSYLRCVAINYAFTANDAKTRTASKAVTKYAELKGAALSLLWAGFNVFGKKQSNTYKLHQINRLKSLSCPAEISKYTCALFHKHILQISA